MPIGCIRVRVRAALTASLAVACVLGAVLQAQTTPISRADAIERAVREGPRLPTALATLAAARARVFAARARPNPTLSGVYSKDSPQLHAWVELPFELPGVRGARRSAADAALAAAMHQFRLDSAVVALDADTAYIQALAAATRTRLSRRTAAEADTLRRITERRAAAGRAAEMDVLLATVVAGREANATAVDSANAVERLFALQSLMGIISAAPRLALTDSLMVTDSLLARTPTDPAIVVEAFTLPVAAAMAQLAAAEQRVRLERRSVWGRPAITVGGEWRDPTGDEPGLLPLVGLAIPLPLLNRNRGGIAVAQAERAKAAATLAQTRLEGRAEIARLVRARDAALARAERDRRLLVDANRVAAMVVTAYRGGTSTVALTLEARAAARQIALQYIDDVTAVLVEGARIRTLLLAPGSAMRPIRGPRLLDADHAVRRPGAPRRDLRPGLDPFRTGGTMTITRLALVSTLVLGVAAMPAAAQNVRTKLPAKLRAQATITDSAARATALREVKGGTITEGELEHENGRLVYSYDIAVPGKAGVEEVQVDAKTGAVVAHEHETPAKEAAEKKAAASTKPAPKKP